MMNNKDLHNLSEDEILSVGDEKIQRMIKNLHRVDAPKDFDFRLKARIANAPPPNYKPRFLPTLRYVLPFSAIILIFTFVIISSVYFGGNNGQVAEIVAPTPVKNRIAPSDVLQTAVPETSAESVPNMILADSTQPKIQAKKKKTISFEDSKFIAARSPKRNRNDLPKGIIADDEEGGGSRTTDLGVAPKVKTPIGIPSFGVTEIAPNNENKNDIITKQILLPRGIEIISENGNRRVTAVKKDSIAERSKVQVGDLIEAIDGEKVSGDAVRSKPLEGKRITVLRGAEKIEISLNK